MPAFYAHQRFGYDVLKHLPEHQQDEIAREKDLFVIGLQGPDPFFYYRPLTQNPVKRLGSRLHNLSGRRYFGKLLPFSEPEKAFLAGVMCHFMLDSTCHGYVWEMTRRGPASHEEIESDFERELLTKDGHVPAATLLTGEFRPSPRSAKTIAAVYQEAVTGLSWPIVEEDLQDVVLFQKVLLCPSRVKREALLAILRPMKKEHSLGGHIVKNEPDPDCHESSEKLLELYGEALQKAVPLVRNYIDAENAEEIREILQDPAFAFDFEGEVHEYAGAV